MEKSSTRTPDQFIDALEPPVGDEIRRLDEVISTGMTGQTRVLWEGKMWGGTEQSIIGYGDYVYQRGKDTIEWFKIGLAAQKNYISLYVNAADGEGYLSRRYADRLGKVKLGSSALSFKTIDDIDLEVLGEMVEETLRLLP